MYIEEEVVRKKKVYVAPCIKCGSEDIKLFDYGYSSPNIGGGECKACKHNVTQNIMSLDPKPSELAVIWNASNDKETLIKAARARIKKDEDFIKSIGG